MADCLYFGFLHLLFKGGVLSIGFKLGKTETGQSRWQASSVVSRFTRLTRDSW